MWKVQLFKLNYDDAEPKAVEEVVRSGWITMGEKTKEFESRFAEFLGGDAKVAAVSNGTAALHLALLALGIGPGDEVVASAFGWQPLAHAIALSGARPLFADVDYWSGTMSPEKAAAAITPASRALLVGNLHRLVRHRRWMPVFAGLILLAMTTRVSGDIWPKIQFSHYIYGALAWAAGVIVWAWRAGPLLFRSDDD